MGKMKIETGYMPFKGFKTFYRVVGEKTDRAPLVLLHGGPGSTHNYFEVLDPLAELTHRQIVSYDQIGCGESYVEGHPELWALDTWMEELSCLLDYLHVTDFHLLGQSWGGMLAIAYAIEKKPQGLRSLILSSTLPQSQLWGKEQHRLITFMSEEDQKAIAEAERTGNFQSPAYLKANDHYVARHEFVIGPDTPECMSQSDGNAEGFQLYRPPLRDLLSDTRRQRYQRPLYTVYRQDDVRQNTKCQMGTLLWSTPHGVYGADGQVSQDDDQLAEDRVIRL